MEQNIASECLLLIFLNCWFTGGGSSGNSIDTGAGGNEGSNFGSETGGGDDVLPDIPPPIASRPIPMIEWTKVQINNGKFETFTTTGN